MIAIAILFLVPILLVGSAALIHATGYLHGDGKKRQGWFYFYMIGTLVSMCAVVGSTFLGDKVMTMLAFILAWESMGLFSSGLVGFESESKESKKATWIYLLSCHAGAVFLILAGAFSFRPEVSQVVIFFLLLCGFGLKIGFPPFHVWLPEAHPAAPAPASAVMSGAMIPLGFFGLVFWTGVTCEPKVIAPYFAWTMLVLGSLAALGGILFALPQRNIKKLLAFSSVENMGIIALGLGLAAFTYTQGDLLTLDGKASVVDGIFTLAALGAALHIVNHAFLKGGLFLGAGSVLRMTGTLDADKLGGLMKKMPWTGTLFTLNAFGLAALPPLPAFLSELCIYIAAIYALSQGILVIPAAIILIVMSLTGGIAAAAYAKIVSATFLGEARGDQSEIKETPKCMIAAQLILFIPVAIMLIPVVLMIAPLWLFRRFLCPRGNTKPRQLTWDCGYEAPTARMAWTGTAFSQPLADTFKAVLRPRTHVKSTKDLFPKEEAIATETDDIVLARGWNPVFHLSARAMQLFHLFQSGSLHFYVLVMILAIAALLIWGAF